MNSSDDLHGRYIHHKGEKYDVLGEAIEVNTRTEYIIYRQNYGSRRWWIRPKDNFFEMINLDGKTIWRFNKTKDEPKIPDVKPRTFFVTHTETDDVYRAKYKKFYGQYLLELENDRGEQIALEFNPANSDG